MSAAPVQLDHALMAAMSKAIVDAFKQFGAQMDDIRTPEGKTTAGHMTIALLRVACMAAILLGNNRDAWIATCAQAFDIAHREVLAKLAKKGAN